MYTHTIPNNDRFNENLRIPARASIFPRRHIIRKSATRAHSHTAKTTIGAPRAYTADLFLVIQMLCALRSAQ